MNGPTAAALAYGLNKSKNESKILVFSLGGGAFDVSLVSTDDNVYELLATNGITHLGGEDFDNALLDYCISDLRD